MNKKHIKDAYTLLNDLNEITLDIRKKITTLENDINWEQDVLLFKNKKHIRNINIELVILNQQVVDNNRKMNVVQSYINRYKQAQ